jgi:hypothetical protein
MAIVYRSVKGSALTSDEVDNNFLELENSVTSLVNDDAYGSGWNGETAISPSQNAVYDKIELLDGLVVHKAGTETITGQKTFDLDILFADTTGLSWASGNVYVKRDNTDLQIQNQQAGGNIFIDCGTGGETVIGGDLLRLSTVVRLDNLTATTVPYLNGSKNLTSSTVTPTELEYLSISDQTNRVLAFGHTDSITSPDALKYKTVFGHNITDGSNRSAIFGQNITTYTGLTNQVIQGDNINVGQYMRSMVIMGNDIDASNVSLVSNAGECVLIGNLVSANNWKQTLVGWGARGQGVADTAIGWCADGRGTTGNHKVLVGRTATGVTAGAGVFGSHTNNNWWFGNGEVHKFENLNGTLESVLPSSRTVILHVGADAWDIQTVPDALVVAGGPGAIAPGVPTSSGARAKLHFYQADGVDLGSNVKQALQSVGYVDTTGDLVWWDLMRINKISSTASCLVAATVASGDIATDYNIKISNEALSCNSKSGTSLLLKIANATRLDITANTSTFSNTVVLFTGTTALAPLRFVSGTNLTSPVDGSIEYNGTNYFGTITSGPTRKTFAFLEAPAFTTSITTPKIIGAAGTPGIAAGTGAGTGPTISITGNDVAGVISILTGTTPAATAIIATITFNVAYGVAPVVAIQAANRNARDNGATKNPLVPAAGETNGVTVTTFVLESAGTNLTAGTLYLYSYQVIQ